MKKIASVLALLSLGALWSCSTTTTTREVSPSESIEKTLRSRTGDFRACYDRNQAAGQAPASGQVFTRFTVGSDGKVLDASIVKSTLQQPPVENCVLARIRETQFPAMHGGGHLVVAYPFRFSGNQK